MLVAKKKSRRKENARRFYLSAPARPDSGTIAVHAFERRQLQQLSCYVSAVAKSPGVKKPVINLKLCNKLGLCDAENGVLSHLQKWWMFERNITSVKRQAARKISIPWIILTEKVYGTS
jgi:hypothetical protein